MLVVPEKSVLFSNLKTLGFRGPDTYQKSKVYLVTKKYVLERDEHLCRRIGCHNPATHVQYVNLNLETLAGAPYLVFSFCESCYRDTFVKSPPDSERHTLAKTFAYVTGIRKTAINGRQIGEAYRQLYTDAASVTAAEKIVEELSVLLPPEKWERLSPYLLKGALCPIPTESGTKT